MQQRERVISGRYTYGLILFLIAACGAKIAQGQEQRVVLQSIHLQEGERIESIELSVKAGSFVGFDPLPMGWYLIIDNNPSQQSSIKGDARIGTAALELDNLLKLEIRVQKIEFANRRFSISGTLIVTKTFEDERRIPLRAENFKLLDNLP